MAIKYAIFCESIKKIIENASLKNGKKQNCAYADALCVLTMGVFQIYMLELLKSDNG